MPLAMADSALRWGAELGRGGQGRVVEVHGRGRRASGERLVAKLYLPDVVLDAAALTRLVAWRRSLDDDGRRAVDEVACWPRAVVVRRDRAVGVLLPRVAPSFAMPVTMPSGAGRPVLRELQYLIAAPALLARRGITDVDLPTRLRVIASFTDTVAALHSRGVVLGDLSVKNVLWLVGDAAPAVYLLDCDAFRLTGTDPPVCQANSPGWDDPAFPGTQNRQSDRYKLALTVLRALARDFHTRDPERARAVLGRRLLPLLRAGLAGEPDARPAATAWGGPLRHRADQLTEIAEE